MMELWGARMGWQGWWRRERWQPGQRGQRGQSRRKRAQEIPAHGAWELPDTLFACLVSSPRSCWGLANPLFFRLCLQKKTAALCSGLGHQANSLEELFSKTPFPATTSMRNMNLRQRDSISCLPDPKGLASSPLPFKWKHPFPLILTKYTDHKHILECFRLDRIF